MAAAAGGCRQTRAAAPRAGTMRPRCANLQRFGTHAHGVATIVLCALVVLAAPSLGQDHPVLAASTCPTRLWAPNEVPRLNQIDITMVPADFRWQIDNQALQYGLAREMNVSINFNGATFPGGSFKVHGGKYQRGGGSWGRAEGDGSGLRGGDCYRGGDRLAI